MKAFILAPKSKFWMCGQDVRKLLVTLWCAEVVGPAFHQLMGRLEDAGLIRIDRSRGRRIGTKYRITSAGKSAIILSLEFYRPFARGPLKLDF